MNRLSSAASPYLRSAAHQPIAWYPWEAEAFAAAREGDKPILLDVGAVWCHWCHVMDGESYEDPALARYLNEHFVCIKVDRDERPDVDARYQRAVQALAGQGGWPLTAFLTPDGEVFFGGTYFPPEDRWGRPGLPAVLDQVLRVWRERREVATGRAAALRRALEQLGGRTAPAEVGGGALLAGERQIVALFDPAFGGFGSSPKFPHPTALRFLAARWADGGSSDARHVVVETLRAMARGGVHDQVGGGFHRYSVDRQWIVPHFEKMAYDNAELLRAYVAAAALFDDAECAAAGRGIVGWVREVLALPGAGFGTSQDADTGPEDDGGYFTWTRDEMARVLSDDELHLAARRFGLGTLGRMPDDPERNVLFLATSLEDLARETGRGVGEIEANLERIVAKLREARRARPTPAVDPTPYASWNAMMAGALLEAAPILGDPWASSHALATLAWLRREAPAPDRLAHRQGDHLGLLEDQVYAADAALTALETSGDSSWLAWAERLMDRAWQEHWDGERGGLTDRPGEEVGEGLLSSPVIPIEDAPAPSPNGVAAIVCARLAGHTGAARWRERQARLVEGFASVAPALGLHAATWLLAADRLVHAPVHMVITGEAGDATARALHQAALATLLPRRVVRRLQPGTSPDGLPAELVALVADAGRPRGYLCLGTRCLAPAEDPAEWRRRLQEAGLRRA